MTALLTAISSGISAKKILEYLMRKSPEMATKISSALASGLSAEKIVQFFSKGQNFEKLKSQMEEQYPMERSANPLVQASQIRSKNMAADAGSQLQRAAPGILGLAGGIGANMALNHALPNLLKGSTQEKIEKNLEIPQQPPVSPNVAQTTQQIQPEIKPINLKDILNKYQGFENKINELIKTKNTPEAIAAYFKKFNPGQTSKIEKEYGKSIDEIIAEYVTANPYDFNQPMSKEEALGAFRNNKMIKHAQEELKPKVEEDKLGFKAAFNTLEGSSTKQLYEGIFDSLKNGKDTFAGIKDPLIQKAKPFYEKGLIKSPEDIKRLVNDPETFNETPKIEKGSTVASPQGVGEVKEIRNGKAIVEVDGKKFQVNEEDLEGEPEDVVETVQQLLKIPEIDRSSIVSLFTYDPEDRKMYIQFHNGETYKYLDVDPEKVRKIAEKNGIPVTEGKNIFGAWSPQDKKSLGATLIQEIISDPKYRKPKKGEPENPNYIKLDTLYDYWEKLRKKPKRKRP